MNPLLKIVVLGEAGVGKSALLAQFVSKVFHGKYKSTIGTDFLTKEVKVGNDAVTLQLWDTAGFERFNSLGATFFRGADCCILVFDLTNPESLMKLDQWRTEFAEQTAIDDTQFPFLYVGNKSDLNGARQVDAARAQQFCTDRKGQLYIETSAKTSDNVEKLFLTAAAQVLKRSNNAPPPKNEVVRLKADKPVSNRQNLQEEEESGGCCGSS